MQGAPLVLAAALGQRSWIHWNSEETEQQVNGTQAAVSRSTWTHVSDIKYLKEKVMKPPNPIQAWMY